MNLTPGPDRWQIIERIFHEALTVAGAGDRRRLIRQMAGTDAGLAGEVQALVDAALGSGAFLEEPPGLDPGDMSQIADRLKAVPPPPPDDATIPVPAGETPPAFPRGGVPTRLSATDQAQILARQFCGFRPEYEILGIAGRGGAGIVFHARDLRLEREVAVKILHRGRPHRPLEEFLQSEARAAAIVNDHVVRLYEIAPGGSPVQFLVMEWIEGPTLRDWLGSHGNLPQREAARLVYQAAIGVRAAHLKGLVHGDLKPANILLEPDRERTNAGNPHRFRAKVTDFGLAHSCGSEKPDGSPAFEGTPAYAAPELLLSGQSGSPASDVWSLGATLYHALTGTSPWSGAVHLIVRNMERSDPAPLRTRDPSVSRDLESICHRALARDPARRYRDAGELAADLLDFLEGKPVRARPVTWFQRAVRWAARNPVPASLSAVSILFAVVLVTGSLITAWKLSAKNSQIREQMELARVARVEKLVAGDPAGLPALIHSGELRGDRDSGFLRRVVADQAGQDYQSRIHAAVLLAGTGSCDAGFLSEAILKGRPSPAQCAILVQGLSHDPDAAISWIAERFAQSTDVAGQARLAVVAAHLGSDGLIRRICSGGGNPEARTALVHGLKDFHASAEELRELLGSNLPPEVLSAVSAALSLFDPRDFSGADRELIADRLNVLQSTTSSGGVFAAAQLALRAWDIPALPRRDESGTDGEIRRFAPDITLLRIPAGTSLVGRLDPQVLHNDNPPHEVRITRDFWLSSCEISVGQFQEFLADPNSDPETRPPDAGTIEPDPQVSPTAGHPMQRVSWTDAARFCNWMSRRHGLKARYRFSGPDGGPLQHPEIDPQASGFRLPSEAEWEHACRAGTVSEYFYGNDTGLLPYYGAFSNSRIVAASPCDRLLPNPFGLSGMHGNVWEWCEDWWSPLGTGSLTDPAGPLQPDVDRPGRVFRGGGVSTMSGEPDSGSRGSADPNSRFRNVGFRIALPGR